MKKLSFLKFVFGLAIVISITLTASLGWATWCIDVTKTCTDAAEFGDPINYTATVQNCGDLPLSVTVTDVTYGFTLLKDTVIRGGNAISWSFPREPDECGETTNRIEAVGIYTNSVTGYSRIVEAYAETTCYVPCDDGGGCTVTPGYWKTRSKYGPAPYDDTWTSIGSGVGSDTPFFLSGDSYFDVLWTVPKGGNAYYILAHAFIAAELNVAAEASMPADVESAWYQAKEYFGKYEPEDQEIGKKGFLRPEMIMLAEILDDYNNGITGPGHCE